MANRTTSSRPAVTSKDNKTVIHDSDHEVTFNDQQTRMDDQHTQQTVVGNELDDDAEFYGNGAS